MNAFIRSPLFPLVGMIVGAFVGFCISYTLVSLFS